MSLTKGKIFVRKPYNSTLYKWSPQIDLSDRAIRTVNNVFCTAVPGGTGEDFIVTYVYNKTVVDGVEHRSAYVECDYVQ